MSIDQLPTTSGSACCTPTTETALTAQDAENLARTLKALADPMRLRLLSIIAAQEDAEACVCDLTEPVGLSQPTVSHHMKVLTEAGLVIRDKRGVWAYFRLAPGAVESLTAHLVQHLTRTDA